MSAGAAAAPQSSLVVAGGSGTAASAVGCGAARRRRGGEVRVEVLLVRGTRGGGGTCECGERADSLAWESRACVNVTSISVFVFQREHPGPSWGLCVSEISWQTVHQGLCCYCKKEHEPVAAAADIVI